MENHIIDPGSQNELPTNIRNARLLERRGFIMADYVDQCLGNYRLLRLLGQGGFAQVYLGEHLRLGTQVAIKMLFTHLPDDEVGHFLAEARALANCCKQ